MARVPLLPADPEHPVLGPLFTRLQKSGAPAPNLYRALANAPELLNAWVRFAWPLRSQPQSPRSLRELLILRVAQLTETDYEWAHHRRMALDAGVNAVLIDALSEWDTNQGFDTATRATLALTDELVTTGSVSDATFDAFSAYADPERIVEVVLTVSFYCCVSRVLHALDIEIEPDR